MILQQVWIFCGAGSRFPAGVFTDKDAALDWILRHQLTGVLSAYPLNAGVYDWAVLQGHFTPASEHEHTPGFVQKFTSASQEHYHVENGVLD